jgi:tetratricopeptide (TPR) repeat protein
MPDSSNPAVALHREIARLLERGELKEAAEAYSKAIALDPRRAVYWFNRAAVLRFLGQLDEAEKDYDQAIRLQPDDCEAYLNRTELRTQTGERNHIDELERLLAGGKSSWLDEVRLRYALAKEYEDLGRYTQSWHYLEQGARLRRAHLQYDIRRDIDTVRWIVDAFPRVTSGSTDGAQSPRPIFIVGLPRSGSTLVERILGSHSDVYAAGELNHFAAVLTAAAQLKAGGRPLPRQQLIEAAREVDFASMGEAYLRRVRSLNFGQPHFTDKMPLNYLYCGLIRQALPQARIVHVTRHPMASCYAMFKNLFKDGYPFSYDFGELAQFYAGYRRLMRHWHESMPGLIYDISYERLVQAQEVETRRLLSACELDWQASCLQFHTNPTATRTASASQVRRPLYDSALRQWRHYEPQLEGLKSKLLAAGIDAQELM